MAKPTIKTKCVASAHDGPDEQTAEVSSNAGDGLGCLINVRRMPDGKLRVDVYRIDPGVEVVVGKPEQ